MLEVLDLGKSFEGVKALDSFSCTAKEGDILGIIGPNGAGKTTFFNVLCGFTNPDRGQLLFQGQNLINMPPHRIAKLGISRTFQDLRLIQSASVLDNVMLCFQQQPGELLRNVFFNWRRCEAEECKNREEAFGLLERTGLASSAVRTAATLSFGQQKLLSLACSLATKATLLLLDEPLGGIAAERSQAILDIIRELAGGGKCVILIEHNMDAVVQVCSRLIFMDAGRAIIEGTPDEVRNDPRVTAAYLA